MATAQNVGAVVRMYDPKTRAYAYTPRAPTNGETYNFIRIVGICFGVRAPHFCNAHLCAQCC